jgi:hypothetical protein
VPDTDALNGRALAKEKPGCFRQARDAVRVRDYASTQERGKEEAREETAANDHGPLPPNGSAFSGLRRSGTAAATPLIPVILP